MDKCELGRNLKKYRTIAGITQADMAKRIGVSQNYLSAVERGMHTCSAVILRGYAEACHVSADRLLGIEEDVSIIPEMINFLSGSSSGQQRIYYEYLLELTKYLEGYNKIKLEYQRKLAELLLEENDE